MKIIKRTAAALCAALLALASCSCRDGDYLTLRRAETDAAAESVVAESDAATEAADTGTPAAGTDTVPAQDTETVTESSRDDYPDTVFITDTGEKYHRAGCRYLSNSSREISLADAQAQGYLPCSQCFN